MSFRRREPQFWESALSRDELTRLADFNGERSRGIVHTAQYAERMARLQARFNTARRAHHEGMGDSRHDGSTR